MEEVGWPEPAAAAARTESTRSCWASSCSWPRSAPVTVDIVLSPRMAVVSRTLPGARRRPEERERGGEAVHERVPANRPELPGGEESGRGHAEVLIDRFGIVVRNPKEAAAAAIAGEQERRVRSSVNAIEEEGLQVLARGGGVAHVVLDSCAQGHDVADSDGADVLIGPQDV